MSNVITFKPKPEKNEACPEVDTQHLMALCAATEFVAEQLGFKEGAIRAMVLAAFKIRQYDQLQECDFENAMNYTVGLLKSLTVLH